MKKRKLSQAALLMLASFEQLRAMGANTSTPLREQPEHIRKIWKALYPALEALLPHLSKYERKVFDGLIGSLRKSNDQSFSE